MTPIKLTIVYYSATGTNYKLAKTAEEAAGRAGAETKVVRVQELAPAELIAKNPAWQTHAEATKYVPIAKVDDLEWADAIIFSSPTRYGGIAAQMKQFIDTTGGLWARGGLANKVVSAMSSAQNPHGGQESTLLSLYTMMYHWGAIVVAPGYTDPTVFAAGGNPYGTSVTVNSENGAIDTAVLDAVRHQARRVVTVAEWIKAGRMAK